MKGIRESLASAQRYRFDYVVRPCTQRVTSGKQQETSSFPDA